MVDTRPDLEKGHREQHSVVPIKFEVFEIPKGDITERFYTNEDVKPVKLNSVIGMIDNFYTRSRREFLGDAFDRTHSIVLTLYSPEGVWALEDHDRDLLIVQVKENHRDQFIAQVDSKFDEELFLSSEMDVEEVIEKSPYNPE